MQETPPESVHVLVAEDDPAAARFYERLLKLNGYRVTIAGDGHQAKSILASGTVDVVLSDIGMPHLNGIQLLQSMGTSDQNPPVILMTGNPDVDTATQAAEGRAVDYLVKPVDSKNLLDTVKKSTQVAELARARRNVMKLLERENSEPRDLCANFDRALETLWLAFQPVVSVAEGRIYSYEVIICNEEETLRDPIKLLAAAEGLHRLPDLGRRVRNRVAARMPAIGEGIYVFIPLHPLDLLDDSLYDASSPLSKYAWRIVFEVNERANVSEIAGVERRLRALRSLGYHFAVDDFGAGYAGLNAFVGLNPTFVKLDTSLIRDIQAHPTKKQLVASIGASCRGLQKLVVAKGVATTQERDALKAMRVDLLQGSIIGRPERDPQPVDAAAL